MRPRKRVGLSAVVEYENQLMEVYAIGEGRTVHMRPVAARRCECCGQLPNVHLLEHSPLFQDHVKPVRTVEDGANP